MPVFRGDTAFEAWPVALSDSDGDVYVGHIWSIDTRWRIFMMVDDNAIAFPAKAARELARAYIQQGGREVPGVSDIIDALFLSADIVDSRNASKEIPPNVLGSMVAAGEA
jgi:hypothetical protein